MLPLPWWERVWVRGRNHVAAPVCRQAGASACERVFHHSVRGLEMNHEVGSDLRESHESEDQPLEFLNVKPLVDRVTKDLLDRFGSNLKALILYGSWAKGVAREDSDIDLLVVLEKTDRETGKVLFEIERSGEGRSITIVASTLEDFLKEKLPLYTAAKKEGRIIYGDVDRSINPEPPEVKYSEFFKRSREFESQKVEVAGELLEKDLLSGIADFCYVASKHAIQAALAMRGEGYSSKVAVLAPLAEKYFGREIGAAFKDLFKLYVKSEYGMDFLSEEEAKNAIDCAKKALEVYDLQPATC
jgi:predicted nucleotidyltransferase